MNDTTLSTFKEALAELYQGIPEAHRNVQWVACEDGSLTTLPSLGIDAVETVALSLPKPFGKILALMHNQLVLDAEATAERKTNSVEEGGTLTNYGSKHVKRQHYAVIALTPGMDQVVQRDDSLAHAIQSAARLVARNGSAVRVYKQEWPHPSVEEGALNLSTRVDDIIKFCDELIRDPDSAEKIRQFNRVSKKAGPRLSSLDCVDTSTHGEVLT
jgi:hypothetical protein